jgi:hypothetical protein
MDRQRGLGLIKIRRKTSETTDSKITLIPFLPSAALLSALMDEELEPVGSFPSRLFIPTEPISSKLSNPNGDRVLFGIKGRT